MKKFPIIDAQTGQPANIGKNIFMNELLLDEKGRKVISPENVKSKVFYYSPSSLSAMGKESNSKEVNVALYLLNQFIHHCTLNIRTEIVSLHSKIRTKLRTYKRHIFIIRTHPLFDKVKKPQVFKKLSKLIEMPLLDLNERLKICSDKFKVDEKSYMKAFPKKIKIKKTETEEEEEGEEEEEEETEGENPSSEPTKTDPFQEQLEKHNKDNFFNELMEVEDEDDKILLSISSSDEDFDEIAEKLEKKKREATTTTKPKKKKEKRNLRTPIPTETEDQKKIVELMEYIHPFEKAISTLKRIKKDSKKCEFKPHVPSYIFSLLEEIRRREKILRILYFKLQDLQSSVFCENENRDNYHSLGGWKRKKGYDNPTDEEKNFLEKRVPEIDVSKVVDARYYELFQSTAGDGVLLEEMVSPISEEDRRKMLMSISTGNSKGSEEEVGKQQPDRKDSFGYITTEDLLKFLKEREDQLAEKNEELAEKEAKIQKLGKSLGETQVCHDEKIREAQNYEKEMQMMNETMVEKEETYKMNLDEERRRYRSLQLQSSQMDTMYNQKIEEMEVVHSQELHRTMQRIKNLEIEIKKTKDEMEKKINNNSSKETEEMKKKQLEELREEYHLEKRKIEAKISVLEVEITEKRKLYESEKLKSTDLTETILQHKSEAETLEEKIRELRASLENSEREAGEANRKYENGLNFVGNVVKLIDEKDLKISRLEKVISNLLKQLKSYWNKSDEEEKKKKKKKKKNVRFEDDDDENF